MKTNEILNLDCRKEENKEIIQKVLRKIKPLSKYPEGEQIPLEAIEKVVDAIVKKYEIVPQYMMMSYQESKSSLYSISVKTTTDHSWLGSVHGISLYEVFAKLTIKMYSEVKSGKVAIKSMSKEEKQRERIAKKVDKS